MKHLKQDSSGKDESEKEDISKRTSKKGQCWNMLNRTNLKKDNPEKKKSER